MSKYVIHLFIFFGFLFEQLLYSFPFVYYLLRPCRFHGCLVMFIGIDQVQNCIVFEFGLVLFRGFAYRSGCSGKSFFSHAIEHLSLVFRGIGKLKVLTTGDFNE